MRDNKTYTFAEAQEATLAYFGGDALATSVWLDRYAMKDNLGNLLELTPTEMHWRMANEIARIEQKYPHPLTAEEVFGLFDHFTYLVPSGSLMAGIGNESGLMPLSSSFVIGLDGNADSYGAILRIDEEQVQLQKRHAGVGHDLGQARPKGAVVHNSALTSSGIVPLMERFSNSAMDVARNGRRGALTLSLSIKHPDAAAFIEAKPEEDKAAGANVAIKITDPFMKAVVENRTYVQQFPLEGDNPVMRKEVSARKLWERVVHSAWKRDEPDVLFWDTILRESLADCYADLGFRTISVNPYGDIPLCAYDGVRSLSLNLYSYVANPFTPEAHFDFDTFSRHAMAAQRIMDDIVDLEIERVESIIAKIDGDPQAAEVKLAERQLWLKIKEKCATGRRTGVGVTAEADMLAALGMRYGSEEATRFAAKVQRALALNVYRSSVDLARERGAFAIYDAQREAANPFILRLKEADEPLYEDMARFGRRNIACLAVAPTGVVSLLTQTTSGIEPVAIPVYKRRRRITDNDTDAHVDYIDEVGDAFEESIIYHRKFLAWMMANGINTKKRYSQDELNDLVRRSPYHQATTNDVDWTEKVRMQAAVQKWVDQHIAMTIHLPANADEDLVSQVYFEAWQNGCKGCAIYRDGSRTEAMITLSKKDKKRIQNENIKDLWQITDWLKPNAQRPQVIEARPKELECDIVRFQNNKEKWVAFVGLVDGKPYEIFTGLQDDEVGIVLPKTVTKGRIIKQTNPDGSHRYDFQFKNRRGYKTTVEGLSEKFNPEYWNYAKLISGVLRYQMPIKHVIKLVSSLQLKSENINTWKVGVERALKKYVGEGAKTNGTKCPVCGQDTLVYQEGGLICTNCGASRCGQ